MKLILRHASVPIQTYEAYTETCIILGVIKAVETTTPCEGISLGAGASWPGPGRGPNTHV